MAFALNIISSDVLLESRSTGAFVGARVKGPVGAKHVAKGKCESPHGMSGIFFAVNASGWQLTFGIGDLGRFSQYEGTYPPELQWKHDHWHRLNLEVDHRTAKGSLDDAILFEGLGVPAPHNVDNGFCDPLGKGGYAAIGTVGYGAVQFHKFHLVSAVASDTQWV